MIAGGRLGAAALLGDDEAVTSRYAYRTPGVHVEFRARRAITPRRTDITGFVGIASRGPVLTPIRVESWSEFAAAFGTHTPSGYLAYAMEAYFAAGGRTAWVVRVAHPGTARPASLALPGDEGSPALLLTAALGGSATGSALPSPGAWANRMTAMITRDGARFDLTFRAPDGLTELWRGLSTSEAGDRFAPSILNDVVTGSRLATALVQPGVDGEPPVPGGPFAFSGGADGLVQLGIGDLLTGIRLLEPIDEIAIVAAPDLQEVPRVDVVEEPPPVDCSSPPAEALPPAPMPDPPEFKAPFDPVQLGLGASELIAQCERRRDRFAILDPPRRAGDPAQAAAFKDGLVPSAYAAMYFPWVAAPDPLHLGGDLVRFVPPSGHIAGVYAATDRAVGVHKPPANVALELAVDLAFRVDDVTHGDANHACLNIVRAYGGRGIRVAGARTLACRAPWRFVNVRRLVAMIEEATEEDLAWAVFEASNEVLWAEVDRQVRGFLDDLWRAGMLDGATADEAFEVRCDAETNPPDQVDLGRLTCLIALRPPPPAEFVVVRVTLSADSAEAATIGAVDA